MLWQRPVGSSQFSGLKAGVAAAVLCWFFSSMPNYSGWIQVGDVKCGLMHTIPFRYSKVIYGFTLGALLFLTQIANAADPTLLPLDPKGSSLKFFCESLMHNFHGEAREFSGSATMDIDAAPPIQKATLRFKTASLTTFIKGRDEKMYDWLKGTLNPDVSFQLQSVKLIGGDYKAADAQHPAQFNVSGTLKLNGVNQRIEGTAKGWREKDRVIIAGETIVDTLKYGLPQIRMAILTVGTNVKIAYNFSFVLPPVYAKK